MENIFNSLCPSAKIKTSWAKNYFSFDSGTYEFLSAAAKSLQPPMTLEILDLKRLSAIPLMNTSISQMENLKPIVTHFIE